MAQTTLPNLASKPLTTSTMCPTDFTATTSLSDVLKSEPVKRLLNQPNIIFKAIPLSATPVSHNKVTNKMNNIHLDVKESKTKSNTTILPDEEENEEDKNLLPSKKKGKSEIMLVPIKSEMKPCGHYEPCENIVCDVAVQQYVDRDGSSPLISTNIEEDEITAPVAKHCKNEKCDALSIDHDRCRRAVVRLYRCNRSKACDICGTELQTRRCRIHHKNCTRKNEYRHNESNGAEILKVRMREREIQMMEASKLSRKDYTDPAAVMQSLKKNEELIVISKSIPVQQPQRQPQSQSQPQPQTNTLNSIFGRLLPNLPLTLSPQNVVPGKSQCSNKNGITTPIQVATPDTINSPFITATNSVPLAHNQYVTFTTQHGSQPLTLNDILFTQSHVMSTPLQSKPVLTPIRVVPITNLITQPSLLHQTQGVPRYCIMADPSIPIPLSLGNPQAMQLGAMSLTLPNQQLIQQRTVPLTLANALQIQPSLVPQSSAVLQSSTVPQPSSVPQPSTVTQSLTVPQQSITVPKPSLTPQKISKIEIPRDYSRYSPHKKRKKSPRKKRRLKKKEFKCEYCLKRFSTDWYFKMHVAKHTGESPHSCKICKESFANFVELRSHRVLNHKKVMSPQNQSFLKKNQIKQQSFQCLDCPANCATMKDLKCHRQLGHGKVACTLCHAEVRQEELVKHFATVHNRTEKIVNKIDASIENGNVSVETSDVEDVTEIDMNSSQVKVETKNEGKMNGHDSNLDEITVDNMKMKLDDDDDHEHDLDDDEDEEEEEEEEGKDDDKNDET